jgi:hypothetical protein
MRDMYREVSYEAALREGLTDKRLNIIVNHMATGRAYNWGYALEWARQLRNMEHGVKAIIARERGAEIVFDYLESDMSFIECESKPRPKNDCQLVSIISASAQDYQWYFGEFFDCGINETKINGVPAAEHYSRLLQAERLHEDCAFINVYTKDGWIATISIKGRTIWHILSEMHKLQTEGIVRVHKRRDRDDWKFKHMPELRSVV